jgi:hypothetical protein
MLQVAISLKITVYSFTALECSLFNYDTVRMGSSFFSNMLVMTYRTSQSDNSQRRIYIFITARTSNLV